MAKSEIIKDLVNEDISLVVGLNRLKVICFELNNIDLNGWIECELKGYDIEKDLPSYRKFKIMNILYSGINRSYQITNHPLPIQSFSEDLQNKIIETSLIHSIMSLENSLKENIVLSQDLTNYAYDVHNNTGISCTQIYKRIDTCIIEVVISNTKNMLLNILLELEKEFGNLDDLDINLDDKKPKEIKDMNKTIFNMINNDESMKMGDKNRLSKSMFSKLKFNRKKKEAD